MRSMAAEDTVKEGGAGDTVKEGGAQGMVEARLFQKMFAYEESYLDREVADVTTRHTEEDPAPNNAMTDIEDTTRDAEQTVPEMVEKRNFPDNEVAVEVQRQLDTDGTEEETQSAEDDDGSMTMKEVREYLRDLYESEHDEDFNDNDCDLFETTCASKDPPNKFPSLIQRLRQLRQTL